MINSDARGYGFQAKMESRLKVEDQLSLDNLESLVDENRALYDGFEEQKFEQTQEFSQEIINQLEIDFRMIRQVAACTGRFSPEAIISLTNTEPHKHELLSLLSGECIIETKDSVQWMLQAEKRKKILDKIFKTGIKPLIRLNPLDDFGKFLQTIIFEHRYPPVDTLDEQAMRVLLNVLETFGKNYKPENIINQLKDRLQTKTFLKNYTHLTENFVGRDEEIHQLRVFIAEKTKNYSWEACALTGIGGSGKSTLLSRFCNLVMEEKLATICILDFDRPGIDPTDPEWLQDEIAKQIAVQFPGHEEEIRMHRYEDNNLKDPYRSKRQSSLEAYHTSKIDIGILDFLRHLLLAAEHRLPFLIILDTLEEVFQQKNWEKLREWISELAEIFYPLEIKIILSGRLYTKIDEHLPTLTIPLENFDWDTTEKFLFSKGLSQETITSIMNSGKVPFRPLDLQLIARILLQNEITIDELLNDIASGESTQTSKEYFTGIIYRRVLFRISDPLIREVAYPGLILRYVNAEIVKHVLQPVLQLPELDETELQNVVNGLANYAWLAYKDENGEVWHRKDLRRIMIRHIEKNNTETVNKIRSSAIAYFEKQPKEKDYAESLYHKLLLEGIAFAKTMKLTDLQICNTYLAQDIEDMPNGIQALLRYARTGEISLDDFELLPEKLRADAYNNTGRKLVSRNQMRDAFNLYLTGQRLNIVIDQHEDNILDRWEMEMLFNLGKFELIRKMIGYLNRRQNTEGVKALINYIFPAALISREKIDRDHVSYLLRLAHPDGVPWISMFNGDDNLTYISRLAMSLALLNEHQVFSRTEIQNIDTLFTAATYEWKPATIESSLLLLKYLGNDGFLSRFRLNIDFIKLDQEWIQELSAKYGFYIEELSSFSDEISKDSTFNGKQFLNTIDSNKDLRKKIDENSLLILGLTGQERVNLLRGPDLIFRNPCEHTIYEAIKDGLDPSLIKNIASRCINVSLNELNQNSFGQANDWLNTVVQVIDRSWKMGLFLQLLTENWPHTDQLNELKETYDFWDQTINNLLLSEPYDHEAFRQTLIFV